MAAIKIEEECIHASLREFLSSDRKNTDPNFFRICSFAAPGLLGIGEIPLNTKYLSNLASWRFFSTIRTFHC